MHPFFLSNISFWIFLRGRSPAWRTRLKDGRDQMMELSGGNKTLLRDRCPSELAFPTAKSYDYPKN